jgi:hypothetical protein
MTFMDVNTAAKMRQVIMTIVSEQINKERPPCRYGIVESINREERKCEVILNGDESAVSVPMGSIQPTESGQVVRIEGRTADRFISDVMGPVHVDAVALAAEDIEVTNTKTETINGDNYFKPPIAIYERTSDLTLADNVLTNIPMQSGPLQNQKNGVPLVSLVSGSATTFTVNHTGWHEFTVSHEWPSTFATSHRLGEIQVNGSTRYFLYIIRPIPGFVSRIPGVRQVYLVEGDTFIFRVRQNEGGTSELSSGTHCIKWLSE